MASTDLNGEYRNNEIKTYKEMYYLQYYMVVSRFLSQVLIYKLNDSKYHGDIVILDILHVFFLIPN